MLDIFIDNDKYEDYCYNVAGVLGIAENEAVVDIEFSRKLDGDAGGYCFGDNEHVEIQIATHVMGEALAEEDILKNIAHEMIHAQQIIQGRLVDHGLQIVSVGDTESIIKAQTWDGEYYTNTAYDDQPWEIDAYAREKNVMNEALNV